MRTLRIRIPNTGARLLGYCKVGLDGLKTLPLEQRICDITIKLEDVVDGRGISWLLFRYPTAKASVYVDTRQNFSR